MRARIIAGCLGKRERVTSARLPLPLIYKPSSHFEPLIPFFHTLLIIQISALQSGTMARGIESNEIGSQKRKVPTLSTQKSSSKQQSIAGFFQKRSDSGSKASTVTPAKRPSEPIAEKNGLQAPRSSSELPASAGAASSSSSPVKDSQTSTRSSVGNGKDKENGMSGMLPVSAAMH